MNDASPLPIGCLLMASGSSRRFGSNKLTCSYKGLTLIERAFLALPEEEFRSVCVVTQYDEIENLAKRRGFLCVRNPHPEEGVSTTIRLGTEALSGTCGAILFQVADQPNLRRETVSSLLAFYRENPDSITCVSSHGRRGNPCIFPSRFYPELLSLKGDTGGRAVIRSHPEALRLFEVDGEELVDIDTREDLLALSPPGTFRR